MALCLHSRSLAVTRGYCTTDPGPGQDPTHTLHWLLLHQRGVWLYPLSGERPPVTARVITRSGSLTPIPLERPGGRWLRHTPIPLDASVPN